MINRAHQHSRSMAIRIEIKENKNCMLETRNWIVDWNVRKYRKLPNRVLSCVFFFFKFMMIADKTNIGMMMQKWHLNKMCYCFVKRFRQSRVGELSVPAFPQIWLLKYVTFWMIWKFILPQYRLTGNGKFWFTHKKFRNSWTETDPHI